jgi:hypothetical protein
VGNGRNSDWVERQRRRRRQPIERVSIERSERVGVQIERL